MKTPRKLKKWAKTKVRSRWPLFGDREIRIRQAARRRGQAEAEFVRYNLEPRSWG